MTALVAISEVPDMHVTIGTKYLHAYSESLAFSIFELAIINPKNVLSIGCEVALKFKNSILSVLKNRRMIELVLDEAADSIDHFAHLFEVNEDHLV